MNKSRIYFDHAATTPLLPEVREYIYEISKSIFGNPSSTHAEGRIAKSFVEEHRKIIATILGCSTSELYFTAGGTESNNLILKSAVHNLGVKKIISTKIEHSCNIESFEWLKRNCQTEINYVAVNQQGQIDINALEELLIKSTSKTLVSLMHVNNELGTILNLDPIGKLCKHYNALFHSDTVQGIGFYQYDLKSNALDFMSGSAHKFYAPKGVGFVYINQQNKIEPLIHGGSQERNMRAGTENILGIGAMSRALSWCHEQFEERMSHLQFIKNYMLTSLQQNFVNLEFNTPIENSSAKILNVQFPFFEGSELLPLILDIEGLSISGGSACNSGAEKASHVISAIRPDDKGKAIRFSFAYSNTKEEVDKAIEILLKSLKGKI
ncbi:MAG: cysteine desulfurase [Saprospiraceae bacterium]|nr:cysteine desulfurase [Saprospiraceae bacterium]